MIFILLLITGASVGFLSGLLGIGGGVVLFPLLLFLPSAIGLEAIGVKSATGLTMTQGFFASLSAMLFYKRQKLVSARLVLVMGGSLFASSLAGAYFSAWVPDSVLLFLFGLLALAAAFMMILPRSYAQDDTEGADVYFNVPLAAGIGLSLGLVLGVLGQGGAFIVIPIMLYVLKIPLRAAMGSMLAIGMFSASAGFVGKFASGQVPITMAAWMIAGAIPAAWAGGVVGRKTHPNFLRWILAGVIAASAVKIWADIL